MKSETDVLDSEHLAALVDPELANIVNKLADLGNLAVCLSVVQLMPDGTLRSRHMGNLLPDVVKAVFASYLQHVSSSAMVPMSKSVN